MSTVGTRRKTSGSCTSSTRAKCDPLPVASREPPKIPSHHVPNLYRSCKGHFRIHVLLVSSSGRILVSPTAWKTRRAVSDINTSVQSLYQRTRMSRQSNHRPSRQVASTGSREDHLISLLLVRALRST